MMELPNTDTVEGQEEVSEMLAKAMNWSNHIDGHDGIHYFVADVNGATIWYGKTPYPNLYEPENMPLAWLVLNWAGETQFFEDMERWAKERMELTQVVVNGQDLPPVKAQRAWLNKVAWLVIESRKGGNAATG